MKRYIQNFFRILDRVEIDKQKTKAYIKRYILRKEITDVDINIIVEQIKSSDDEVLPFDIKCAVAFLNENMSLSIKDYFFEYEVVGYIELIRKN